MEFFESLTDMMERIGEHLSYLSEYATDAFQKSAKIQQVRAMHGIRSQCSDPQLISY